MINKLCVTLLVSVCTLSLLAQENVEIPAVKGKEEIIHHKNYTVAYVEAYELPLWVAYELKADEIKEGVTYKEKYNEDPLVTTGTASMKDYKEGGYVPGLLAPVKDMLFSPEAISECFYFSNVAPMKPAFEKYTWTKLGDLARQWAKDAGTLYIVTGPVLADSPFPAFGDNKVSVPARFYKVILDLKHERGIGFVVKNSTTSGSMKPYAMSIDKVEEITGIDFFPKLDDELENKIESVYDPTKWDFGVVK